MRKSNNFFYKNWIFLLSLAVLLVVWHLLTVNEIVSPIYLPSIPKMLTSGVKLFLEKSFLIDIGYSIYRVFAAFSLSVALALPLAIAMVQINWLRKVLSPYIDFIRYIPVPALSALTIIFIGIDESAKIILLFIGTFFQLILLIIDDLDNIPVTYYDLAFTLHYNKWRIIKMQLWSILPNLYDNLRIILGWCWTYVVIAELIASEQGIGHTIKEAQRFSNLADVFVCLFTMGLIGYGTDYLFKFCSQH